MYGQNRRSNFDPFSYCFDRSISFDGRNKIFRPIFISVTIGGVIKSSSTLILQMGA